MRQVTLMAMLPIFCWGATIDFQNVNSVDGDMKANQACQKAFSGTLQINRLAHDRFVVIGESEGEAQLLNLVRGRKHRVVYNYGEIRINKGDLVHFSGVGLSDDKISGVFYSKKCQGNYSYQMQKK